MLGLLLVPGLLAFFCVHKPIHGVGCMLVPGAFLALSVFRLLELRARPPENMGCGMEGGMCAMMFVLSLFWVVTMGAACMLGCARRRPARDEAGTGFNRQEESP